MLELGCVSVGLVGFGKSNEAMYRYLKKNGYAPVIRCDKECDVPKGAVAILGDGYLDTKEDVVFRSPGVRRDKIRGERVYTEAIYALNKMKGCKIGVTGSDGKTTTATFIYLMLMAGGKNAFLAGNIGKPLIDLVDTVGEDDTTVAELSSFQLMGEAVELDVAAITNVTENHLDYHRDMDEYISAKAEILKNAKRGVVSYDNEIARGLARRGDAYFSLSDLSCLVGSGYDCVYVKDGVVKYNGDELFPVSHICLKGEYNVKNVLCAVGCAYPLVGRDACYRVAREFCGVGGRRELVGEKNGVKYYCSAVDTTPSRTVATLRSFELEKTVAILGGYDKRLSYDILSPVLNRAKGVILCGENRERIGRVCYRRVINVNTLEEAVAVAHEMAQDGDCVVLSPASASFDMFKNYKEKADRYVRAVKETLNGED